MGVLYSLLFESKRARKLAQIYGKKLVQRVKQDNGMVKPEDLEDPEKIIDELIDKGFDKALEWVIQRYIAGEFLWEDLDGLKNSLEVYFKRRNLLPQEQRDISKLRYSDLNQIVLDLQQKKSKTQQWKEYVKKLYDEGEIEIAYKSPRVTVFIPKTKEASCFLGKGTTWCVAATKSENYYHQYVESGPLHFFFFKDKSGKLRKYAMHIERNEFQNEMNDFDYKNFVLQNPEVADDLLKNYPPFEKFSFNYVDTMIGNVIKRIFGFPVGGFLSPKLVNKLFAEEIPKTKSFIKLLIKFGNNVLKKTKEGSRRYVATQRAIEYLNNML